MPILKAMITGNGLSQAATVEEVLAKRNDMSGDGWAVQVRLYPDLESAKSGSNLLWQLYPRVPFDAVDVSDVFGSIEKYLTTSEGDLQGGTYVPYVSETPLEDAKAKKWAQIKGDRVRAEDAGFEVPSLGVFQSDNESRQKIVGAGLAAKIAKDDGKPYTVDWTLADNSVISLNAEQMIEVGQDLLVYLDGVHQRSRRLYGLIEAATTVEDVEAINWSTEE